MNAPVQFAGQTDPWSRRRAKKAARLARIAPWMKGLVLETGAIVEALQALLEPGDAVALEGDNQKQADFLSRALVQVDPAKLHDLHLLDLERQPAGTSDAVRAAASPASSISRSPARRAFAWRNSSRTGSSRSAPFTPMSNSMRGCSST